MEYLDTKLCLAGKKVVGRRGAKVDSGIAKKEGHLEIA
jgi:hypothetical protein